MHWLKQIRDSTSSQSKSSCSVEVIGSYFSFCSVCMFFSMTGLVSLFLMLDPRQTIYWLFYSAITLFEHSGVVSKVVTFTVHACCNWLLSHLHPSHCGKLICQRLKCTTIPFKQLFSCVREQWRITELGGAKHQSKIISIYLAPPSDFSHFHGRYLMSEPKALMDETVIRKITDSGSMKSSLTD